MPHVMNDTEILEQLSRSLEADTVAPQPSVLPLPRRGPARLVTALRRLLSWPRKVHLSWRRQQGLHAPEQPFELPVDTLARQHPYLYIKSLSG